MTILRETTEQPFSCPAPPVWGPEGVAVRIHISWGGRERQEPTRVTTAPPWAWTALGTHWHTLAPRKPPQGLCVWVAPAWGWGSSSLVHGPAVPLLELWLWLHSHRATWTGLSTENLLESPEARLAPPCTWLSWNQVCLGPSWTPQEAPTQRSAPSLRVLAWGRPCCPLSQQPDSSLRSPTAPTHL